MASITRYLEQKLKLKVNQEKSKVAHTNEITFLGFAFSGAKIRWSDNAFARFKQRLKELTGRSWGVSMEFRFAKLAEYLRGWMGYISVYPSCMLLSRKLITGCVAGCVCAIGSNGVTAAPRFAS